MANMKNHATNAFLAHIRIWHWLAYAAIGVTVSSLSGCQTVGATPSGAVMVKLVAGTYDTKGSEGIYGLTFDPANGNFGQPDLLANADNPSWISVSGERMYVVNELTEGRLSTYAVASNGSISMITSSPTLGASPCYVAVSPDRRYVATANYMGGSVSVFALDPEGLAKAGPQVLQHAGKGPNPARQEAPHAHWVQWNKQQNFLYSVDLGLDEVKAYPFDSKTGRAGSALSALKLQSGDGPRHLSFHPSLATAYVLSELSNTVTVVDQHSDGTLQERQRIGTLPDDFAVHSQAAHLYVSANGRNLYASNRGHDSIAVFAIATDGTLSLLQVSAVMGNWPRSFLVLEDSRTLLVANQESHNIVAFTIAADGTLKATGKEIALPQVTFLGRL